MPPLSPPACPFPFRTAGRVPAAGFCTPTQRCGWTGPPEDGAERRALQPVASEVKDCWGPSLREPAPAPHTAPWSRATAELPLAAMTRYRPGPEGGRGRASGARRSAPARAGTETRLAGSRGVAAPLFPVTPGFLRLLGPAGHRSWRREQSPQPGTAAASEGSEGQKPEEPSAGQARGLEAGQQGQTE